MTDQEFNKVLAEAGVLVRSDESTALQIKNLLYKLQGEIGEQPWIMRAIVAVDALEHNPNGIDKYGRPLYSDGKPYPGFTRMICR